MRPDILLLAAATISSGMMIRNGRYHPVALALVVVGAVLAYVALFRQDDPTRAAFVRRVRAAFVLQAFAMLASVSRHLIDLLRAGETALGVLLALSAMALLAIGWDALGASPRLARVWLPAMSITLSVMVLTVIVGLGPVLNDVYHLQTMGTERLFDGISPYAAGYPDIYAPRFSREFYGPDLSIDGVLQFGYAYPPLSLVLGIPGWLLGDVRLASLAAVLLTAWLMARTGERWLGRVAAASFLASAPILFVVTQGWTEPFVVLMLALFVALQWRAPGSAVAAGVFGLFITSKQYGLLFLPLYGLVVPRPVIWRKLLRNVGIGIATAGAIAAPFLIWDWPGVWSSITHLLSLPVRRDALSLLGVAPDLGLIGAIAPFLAAGCAFAVVWRKAGHDTSAFAAGVAVVLLTTVLFAKQAFANYFFTVTTALFLAVAVSRWPCRSMVEDPEPANSR